MAYLALEEAKDAWYDLFPRSPSDPKARTIWRKYLVTLKKTYRILNHQLGPHHPLVVRCCSLLSDFYDWADQDRHADAWFSNALKPFVAVNGISTQHRIKVDLVNPVVPLLRELPSVLLSHPFHESSEHPSLPSWCLELIHHGIRENGMDPLALGHDGLDPLMLVQASLLCPNETIQKQGLEVFEAVLKRALQGQDFRLGP